MKIAYGLQVDAWGALVMNKGDLADELKEMTISTVEERGLEELKITEESVSLDGRSTEDARPHVIFQQDLSQGGLATVALRLARKGAQDLEISWRLFEKNVRTEMAWGLSQGALVFWGLVFLGAGILGSVVGIGLCFLPVGLVLLGAGLGWWRLGKKKTSASTYQQFDSRGLVQMVDYALMKALSSKGVAAQELRVLQEATISGLGKLAKTDAVDDLTASIS